MEAAHSHNGGHPPGGRQAPVEVFDRLAQEGLGEHMQAWNEPLFEQVLEDIGPSAGARVLEIGCGEGWAARRLARTCPEGAIVAIDPSQEFIHRAREKSASYENALFALGEAEEIPWAEDYFDHVISIDSAEYWRSPERAAGEIRRVLAYGGRFHLLLHYFQENPHTSHWDDALGLKLSRLSSAEWAELFRQNGLDEVESTVLVDASRTPLFFQGEPFWRSRRERRRFQQLGSLYVRGKKAGLPPRQDPPPDPLPVLR